MKKTLLFLAILLTVSIGPTDASTQLQNTLAKIEMSTDSTRLAELDHYWAKMSQTVKEGDYEGYGALYHPDAVVVLATREDKSSMPIAEALAGWEKGFKETKEGKNQNKVEFRFSQRIGDETTAHETGLFLFTSIDSNGKVLSKSVIHLEMLLVKKDGSWYGLMEYQISVGTMEEWEGLE